MMTAGPESAHEIVIACEDNYEAQKLASLILVRDTPDEGPNGEDADRTYLKAVINVIANEVIISLADGSSHSVLFEDEAAADAFVDFVQSVTEGRHRLIMTRVAWGDKNVTIIKSDCG